MINPFKKTYTPEEMRLFRFLVRIKLFEKLSNKELYQFIPYMHERVYQLDEAVFFRKDPSHALYLIKSGKVKLHLDIKDRFEELTEVRHNALFGENALLPKSRRVYNAVVSSERAEFYVIPKDNILQIFEQHPELKAKMLEALGEFYNEFFINLFDKYRKSYGFFDLKEVYKEEGV